MLVTTLWIFITFGFIEETRGVRVSKKDIGGLNRKKLSIEDGYIPFIQPQLNYRPFAYQAVKEPPNFQNTYEGTSYFTSDDNPEFRQNGAQIPLPGAHEDNNLSVADWSHLDPGNKFSNPKQNSRDEETSGDDSEEQQLIKEIHREAMQANADMENLTKTYKEQENNETMMELLKRPGFDWKVKAQNKTVMRLQVGNNTDVKDFIDQLQVEKGVRRQLLEHLIRAKVDAKLTARALEAMVEHFKVTTETLQTWKLPEGVKRAILRARIHVLPKEKQLALAERISNMVISNKKKTDIERMKSNMPKRESKQRRMRPMLKGKSGTTTKNALTVKVN